MTAQGSGKRNAFDNPLPGVPNIESPFFDDIFGRLDLTDDERRIARDLRDHGFAVLTFPEPDFDAIAERIKGSLRSRYDWESWRPNAMGLRIQDAWTFDPDVRRIAANAHMLDLLTRLYGRRAWPFQTLNFPVGTEQHFHTDSVHFSSFPERFMCGVWTALEDIDADNGPLVYYPGSHKWPVYGNEHIAQSVAGSESSRNQTVFEPLWRDLVRVHGVRPERFLPKKGQALIWTANLLHGGDMQNDRERTRWSQVTHYYFDNCAYYTPMLSDTPSGKIDFRRVRNICTGELVDNMYAGRKISDRFIKAAQRGHAPFLRLAIRRGKRTLAKLTGR